MREIEIAPSDWADYFASLSTLGAGARTTVEVLSGASVAPAAAHPGWLLKECRHEPEGDLIELTLLAGGALSPTLRCFVSEPREVIARESQLERSILIRDSAGAQTLVRVRRPATRTHGASEGSPWRTDTSRPGGSRIRLRASSEAGRGIGGGGR